MNDIEFMKARDDLGAYRKVHFYLSHIVRYFQNLERQQKKPHVDLKIIYSNLPEVFSTVNTKLKEYTETVQTKDSKLWKLVLKNWRLMVLKNLFVCKGWTDPFQWPVITVEDLTTAGVEQNIAEIFVNNVNVWSRTHWKVGSIVEAWICDQQCWAVGTILQIENDSGVDRLIIGYDNGTRNIIKKTSKYLRPTVAKREMKKEWCYGLKTIKEDVSKELNEELEILKEKNSDLESQIAELIVQNEELLEENEDMSKVLEHHFETFTQYECDPELILDCEERRMEAEANYEALVKKQNEMLKKHKEEMKQLKLAMQKEIDAVKLQLKKSSPTKSQSRTIKRGRTCPNFKSKYRSLSKNKENSQEVQELRERLASMKNGHSRRKHRVIKRNPSRSKRTNNTNVNSSIPAPSSPSMKKLPLETASFSYLNVSNKDVDNASCVSEEMENSVVRSQNLQVPSKNANEWNSKNPRFRSISAPSKKSSRRSAHDSKPDVGHAYSYSADASVSPQKTKNEVMKRNDPSLVSDDLAFLASRVTALQDKLKAYHYSHTRSRSISDSRSRSSSSDSEDVGMEQSLDEMEKRLKCKQQEKQDMLQELELDIRKFLMEEFCAQRFSFLLAKVQSLKHNFERDESSANEKNGATPESANVQNFVNNQKHKIKNDDNKVVVSSHSLERKKSPPKRLRNRGQKMKHEHTNIGEISKSIRTVTTRGETRKSPAKEKQTPNSREAGAGCRSLKKTTTRKFIPKETLAAGVEMNSRENLETPPPASVSTNYERSHASTRTTPRKTPPSLVFSTPVGSTSNTITPGNEMSNALEEMGGGIMKSPRNTEFVPQLVY